MNFIRPYSYDLAIVSTFVVLPNFISELTAHVGYTLHSKMRDLALLDSIGKSDKDEFSLLSLCPNKVSWIKSLRSFFSKPYELIKYVSTNIPKKFQQTEQAQIIAESVFFGITHHFLLREIPKMLIDRVSKNPTNYITPILAVFRVSISTFVYTLSHLDYWDCIAGGTMHLAPLGFSMGILTELLGSVQSTPFKIASLVSYLPVMNFFNNKTRNTMAEISYQNRKTPNMPH